MNWNLIMNEWSNLDPTSFLFFRTVCPFQGQTNWRKECCQLQNLWNSSMSISGNHQDWDKNRTKLHCYILAVLYSIFTFAIFRKITWIQLTWSVLLEMVFFLFYCLESYRSIKSHLHVDLCHQQTSLLTTIQCKLCWFQWPTWHKHVVSFGSWWT